MSKRKPTTMHVIEGTLRAHQKRRQEWEPDTDDDVALDKPPGHFDKLRKEIWAQAVSAAAPGQIRTQDLRTFTNWVEAVAEMHTAELELKKCGGPVITIPSYFRVVAINKAGEEKGYQVPEQQKISPWVRVRQVAFLRFMKAVQELGFSPVSRTRINLKASAVPSADKATESKNSFAKNAQAARKRA